MKAIKSYDEFVEKFNSYSENKQDVTQLVNLINTNGEYFFTMLRNIAYKSERGPYFYNNWIVLILKNFSAGVDPVIMSYVVDLYMKLVIKDVKDGKQVWAN